MTLVMGRSREVERKEEALIKGALWSILTSAVHSSSLLCVGRRQRGCQPRLARCVVCPWALLCRKHVKDEMTSLNLVTDVSAAS